MKRFEIEKLLNKYHVKKVKARPLSIESVEKAMVPSGIDGTTLRNLKIPSPLLPTTK